MGKNTLAPGFRFHPTDLELVMYYLKRKVLGKKFSVNAPIAEVDIYKFAPWDLPEKSCLKTGDLKWYFFCPIAKKYGKGGRLNRATVYGYWKTTGKDRPVEHNGEVVGMRKTLVFHRGKAPSGERTDWVMHEYRLEEKKLADRGIVQDSYVLCVVFEKEGMGPRNGAQYGAPFKEEDWSDDDEETNLIGTGSLCGMSAVAVGGASSSLASPVGGASSSFVSPVGGASSSLASPVGGASSSLASPVGGASSSLASPVGGASSSFVSPVGGASSSLVSPVGGASSSFVSPVGGASSSLASPVGVASSSLAPESLCVGPYVESSGLYTPPLVNFNIDSTAYAAPTLVDARPEVPLVADAGIVPAFLEAPFARDEEPNGNVLTLLDSFHADDAFLPCGRDQTNLPHVSDEDNDVVLMLESFTEVDDPSNWSYPFE